MLSAAATNHANAAAGAALSIASPSTTIGDILVACLNAGNTSDTVTPGQSGWTAIGTSPSSGNSGAAATLYWRPVAAGDPTNWTFTFGLSDIHNGGIVAVTGGPDLTTPVIQQSISNFTTTTGQQTAGPLTPNRLNCLPLAFFGVQNSGSGSITGLASGWSQAYAEDTTTGANAAYHSSQGQVGAITSDMTTPITATATWPAFTTEDGYAVLLLIQPQVIGNIIASPSSLNLVGTGTSNAKQLVLTESGFTGNFTLSNVATAPGQVAFSTTQNGTYTPTLTIACPATLWVQQTTVGDWQIIANGG